MKNGSPPFYVHLIPRIRKKDDGGLYGCDTNLPVVANILIYLFIYLFTNIRIYLLELF